MPLEGRIGAVGAAYVAEVTRRLQAAVGQRLWGAWLLGSAALGDSSPERSDLDVHAISTARLPRAERLALAESLMHEALPCPARGLEFVLYAREDLTAPGGPAFSLNLNTGERMERHLALDAHEDPAFWFVVDLSIGRQHGLTLAGPPAASALPDLPRSMVLGALREALAWHEEFGSGAETVLGACRSWAWASDGEWRSKSEAARWARGRLADPSPVDEALRKRERGSALRPTRDEAGAVVEAARAALDATARA